MRDLWEDLIVPLLIFVGLMVVLGGAAIMGLASYESKRAPARDADCERSCRAFSARKIDRTSYGCFCEGEDGKRFTLQEPRSESAQTAIVPMPIVIPVGGGR